jgi:hypothetical protein
VRLKAEVLESREVPAAFWWAPNPSNPVATVASNWRQGDGTLAAQWNRLPGYADDLYFQQRTTSEEVEIGNFDCNIPLWAVAGGEEGGPPAGSPDFAGLHLVNGYSKTVNLQRSPTVGTLEMASASGKIAQNDPATASQGSGGTLTISSSLSWTGGSLNYGPLSSLVGTINLAATATGVAAPTNDGTVSLGSNLKLLGNTATQTGSTLTMQDGRYDLYRGVNLHATRYCNLNLAPVNFLGATKIIIDGKEATQDEKGTIEVDPDSRCVIKPASRPANNNKWAEVALTGTSPIFRNKGWTFIEDHTQLQIHPTAGQNSGYYEQTSDLGEEAKALTRLEGGSMIDCTGLGKLNAGHVNIYAGRLAHTFEPDSSGEPKASQRAAEIVAPDTTTIPALYVGASGKVTTTRCTVFCTLKVTGEIKCLGDIELFLDRTALRSDEIRATKVITFAANQGTKLTLAWLDASAGPPIAQVNQQQTNVYIVLHSDHVQTGINTPPSVTYPSDNEITVTGNRHSGLKEWAAWRQ